MKILHLKYKMHKLVNLVFYLIIFGVGFLLGFGAEKINFNKLISQYLFVDNVYALESNSACTESENLVDINSYVPSADQGLLIKNVLTVGETYTVSFENPNNLTYIFLTKINAWSSSLDDMLDLHTNKSFSFVYTQAMYDKGYMFFILSSTDANPISVDELKSLNLQIKQKKCVVEEKEDSFYEFSQKIFGEVGEENKFIYDFITFGLVATCFTLFILIVGFIVFEFFGG